MQKWIGFLLFSVVLISCGVQRETLLKESKEAQEELNQEYTDEETSILTEEDFENFEGLEFYPLDKKYIVKADFVRTPDEKPFKMETTTNRKPEYVKYGELHFKLDGKSLQLNVYQETSFKDNPKLKDYLFLPFKDNTIGEGTYGGGRYMDLKIPEKKKIILDFNKAYNPYCAYNAKYSCPIVPEENDLDVEIKAGVKEFYSEL